MKLDEAEMSYEGEAEYAHPWYHQNLSCPRSSSTHLNVAVLLNCDNQHHNNFPRFLNLPEAANCRLKCQKKKESDTACEYRIR